MADNNFLEYVRDVSRDPLAQIKKYADEGRRMVGYMCSYVPEELLYAAGLLPVRLIGRAQRISKADRHLQTYCCSHVRGFQEDFLDGAYSALEGVMFAHTCDTMQSFFDIFRFNNPKLFTHNMNFPVRIDTPASFDYALAEFRRMKARVESHTGAPIDAAKLADAVEVYNENRRLLERMYEVHSADPGVFSSVTLLRTVLASMFSDKRELNPKLKAFLEEVKPGGGATLKRLVLAGPVNINEEIYDLADEFGAAVVDDDVCTGRRYFHGAAAGPSDEQITRRYYDRPHCPSKHKGTTARGEYILDLARRAKADGVIFLQLKFCDPHSFDYPYIRDMLEKAKLRTHLIEVEQTVAPSGQLRTKMQAFVETL